MVFEPHFDSRDSDTHMHVQSDLHVSLNEMTPVRQPSNWERQLIRNDFVEMNSLEDNY